MHDSTVDAQLYLLPAPMISLPTEEITCARASLCCDVPAVAELPKAANILFYTQQWLLTL